MASNRSKTSKYIKTLFCNKKGRITLSYFNRAARNVRPNHYQYLKVHNSQNPGYVMFNPECTLLNEEMQIEKEHMCAYCLESIKGSPI